MSCYAPYEAPWGQASCRLLTIAMVSRCGVWIDSNPGGIDMDDGVRQVWDVMEQLVVGDLGDLVRSGDGQRTTYVKSRPLGLSSAAPTRSFVHHVRGGQGNVAGLVAGIMVKALAH
jgi:hypothetical protein